jgi:nucleoid DNA-binding protein
VSQRVQANRSDVEYRLAELGIPSPETVMDAIYETLFELLRRCGKVNLRGLGVFELRHRRPTVRHHPKTGAAIPVPAKVALAFRPSPIAKKKLNSQVGRS